MSVTNRYHQMAHTFKIGDQRINISLFNLMKDYNENVFIMHINSPDEAYDIIKVDKLSISVPKSIVYKLWGPYTAKMVPDVLYRVLGYNNILKYLFSDYPFSIDISPDSLDTIKQHGPPGLLQFITIIERPIRKSATIDDLKVGQRAYYEGKEYIIVGIDEDEELIMCKIGKKVITLSPSDLEI
jgi:hypothetical protein